MVFARIELTTSAQVGVRGYLLFNRPLGDEGCDPEIKKVIPWSISPEPEFLNVTAIRDSVRGLLP